MGEARNRLTATRRFLAEHPYCCFCGGGVLAETRDHLPPKCFFDKKHVPDDLVVPACKPCNSRSKASDQIAAFVSRIGFDEPPILVREEFRKLGKAITRNNPEVSDEWFTTNRRAKQKVRFFAAKHGINYGEEPGAIAFGPNSTKHFNLFAHKLTLGLFYDCTGQILSERGGFIAFFQPKEVILEHGLPQFILQSLGPLDTLKQARWELIEQFRYRWGWNPDEGVFGHVSLFRAAFAVIGFAIADMSLLKTAEDRSGLLKPTELFDVLERDEYRSIVPNFPARAA